MVGTARVVGEWRGVVAVLLVLLAFVLKSRVEEERMRETFPEYEGYRRESAALLPFVLLTPSAPIPRPAGRRAQWESR